MIYYTVFDANSNKIADCGNERDAKFLAEVRKGTYKTNRLEWKETVEVQPLQKLELPTNDIVVNMDGGVGGSWFEVGGQKLPMQQQEPFIPNFHD